jgi:hypothetical protein
MISLVFHLMLSFHVLIKQETNAHYIILDYIEGLKKQKDFENCFDSFLVSLKSLLLKIK